MLESRNERNNQKIEEALDLIGKGTETLESCARYYGREWADMRLAVETSLLLRETSREEKQLIEQSFDLEALWAKIQPGIGPTVTLTELLPLPTAAADSGSDSIWENEPLVKTRIISLEAVRRERQARRNKWQGLLSRVAIILLGFTLFTTAFTGMAQASEPGDALYDSKLVIDHADEWFSFSEQGKAEARLAYADRRLSEIERAVQQGRYDNLDKTFASYKEAVGNAFSLKDAANLATRLEGQQKRLNFLEQNSALPATLKTEVVQMVDTVEKLPAKTSNKPEFTATPEPVSTQAPAPTATAVATTTAAVSTSTATAVSTSTATAISTSTATATVPARTETAKPELTEAAKPELTEAAKPEPTEAAKPEPTDTPAIEPTSTPVPLPTATPLPKPANTRPPATTVPATPAKQIEPTDKPGNPDPGKPADPTNSPEIGKPTDKPGNPDPGKLADPAATSTTKPGNPNPGNPKPTDPPAAPTTQPPGNGNGGGNGGRPTPKK